MANKERNHTQNIIWTCPFLPVLSPVHPKQDVNECWFVHRTISDINCSVFYSIVHGFYSGGSGGRNRNEYLWYPVCGEFSPLYIPWTHWFNIKQRDLLGPSFRETPWNWFGNAIHREQLNWTNESSLSPLDSIILLITFCSSCYCWLQITINYIGINCHLLNDMYYAIERHY